MTKLEARIIAYAGKDYAKARDIECAELDFFDFDGTPLVEIEAAIVAFRLEVEGQKVVYDFSHGWDEIPAKARLITYRKETEKEISVRIAGYWYEIHRADAIRRAEYMRMKREFGE